MGKKKTPLLLKLRNIGGTLYVFPSATEDIGLNLLSTTTGVAMSHFALLNIPELAVDNCLRMCKDTTIIYNDTNEVLAMSLLNYAMNFETLLTNQESYNYQRLETVSEKVFWHWAEHIGILDPNNLYNNITGTTNIFYEGNNKPSVIKCFGAIDAGNLLSTEFGMFNETYINIPTSWGAGPTYLKQSSDENYTLNNAYPVLETGHLEGREDNIPYYSYTNKQDFPYYDVEVEGRAMYKTGVNRDGLLIVKDLTQIQTVTRKKYNNDEIIFGSYDDINIDPNNNLNLSSEFDFNAVLLYYSVYDQDDLVKTPYAINLFGIIFLDGTRAKNINPENNQVTSFYIPSITKRKSTTQQFGNSYSFRVNLKTMSVYDNTDAIIQDNTTMSGVSAVEFSDAISNMNRAIDIMNSNLSTTLAIQDQYAAIINYYDNFEDDLHDISTCLNAYLKGSRSSFVDTSILYVKEIRTSEAADAANPNTILINTHKANKDFSGNYIYNEPVVTIKDTSVIIPTLENTTMWNKASYVIVDDTNITDPDVNINNSEYAIDVSIANKILDEAFGTEDGLVVKLKMKEDPNHPGMMVSNNELYIDPNSTVFSNVNLNNLSFLKDKNDNINYVALIPYLIAEIKKLHKMVGYMNQDWSPITSDELYNEIFVEE